ncbi:hypothetical protein [Streptomyces violascens]|uniref:hypothetical protein n=1 Tax=Streptomyces violascens TaxID=67381 RepID=UPI0036C388F0
MLLQKTSTLPSSSLNVRASRTAASVRATTACVERAPSLGAASMGICQVSRVGRHEVRISRALSHAATWSALATIAESPTMRVWELASRTRVRTASSTAPRPGSPSRWNSSTTRQPTSAIA